MRVGVEMAGSEQLFQIGVDENPRQPRALDPHDVGVIKMTTGAHLLNKDLLRRQAGQCVRDKDALGFAERSRKPPDIFGLLAKIGLLAQVEPYFADQPGGALPS